MKIIITLLFITVLQSTCFSQILYPSKSVFNVMDYANGAAINDGSTDATAAIQAAIDDLAELEYAGNLALSTSYPLYFPEGTYRITGSIDIPGRDPAGGGSGSAMTLLGAGKEYTKIKLASGTFTDTSNPVPVISHFNNGPDENFTNIAFMNNIMDMTIEIEGGNPGAIGIRYIANNQGTLRNVDIIGNGALTGIDMELVAIPGPALIKNVTISGFNDGVRVGSTNYSMVMENITIENIANTALYNDGHVLSIHNLTTSNISGASIENVGVDGSITLVTANLSGNGTNAIENDGYIFTRNISVSGYSGSLRDHSEPVINGNIAEYYHGDTIKLWDESPSTSLGIGPIQDTPDAPLADSANWVNVTDAQFSPDGMTPFIIGTNEAPNFSDDIGPYIVNAISYMNQTGNEAKNTLFFPPGNYRINSKDITISGNVQRIIGNMAGIATKRSIETDDIPLFNIHSTNYPELYIERMNFIANGASSVPSQSDRRKKMPIFSNSSSTDIVLRNILIGHGKAYKNAGASGTLYIEDVCALSQHFYTNDNFENAVHVEAQPQFEFGNQTVWARQFDTEQRNVHAETNGGQLWILGIKTEQTGPVLYARNNAKMELLGGLILPSEPIDELPINSEGEIEETSTLPAILVENSDVSVVVVEHVGAGNFARGGYYKRIITETRGNEVRHIDRGETPVRLADEGFNTFVLPLYRSNGAGLVSCPSPELLIVDTTTLNTAEFDWKVTGDGGYTFQYRLLEEDAEWQEIQTSTNELTLTGLTPHTIYEARVSATCGSTSSYFNSPIQFSTKNNESGPIEPNLALNKPVEVDSAFLAQLKDVNGNDVVDVNGDPVYEDEPQYPGANAVDGSREDDDRFMSVQFYAPHWVQVDLEQDYSVDQAKLYLGFDRSRAPDNFKLQYLVDPLGDSTWTDIGGTDITNNPESNTDFDLQFDQPITARYFRLFTDNFFLRLREFELYETNTTYPNAELTSIFPSEYVNAGEVVQIKGTATPLVAGSTIEKVEFLLDGEVMPSANDLGSGNYITTWISTEGVHEFKMRTIDSNGTPFVSDPISLSVFISEGNIALNKLAYADSQFDSRFPAGNAVDGSTGNEEENRWMSSNDSNNDHWLVVDLFGLYEISNTEIFMGFNDTNAPSNYKLQSWDESSANWSDIAETVITNNLITKVDTTIHFSPIQTTKVRFVSTDAFVRLRELKVIGTLIEPIKNIALNKPVNGTELSSRPLEEGVDGDIDSESRWMSAFSPNAFQDYEIDLGNMYAVDSVHVFWGDLTSGSGYIERAPEEFELQYWDNNTWVTIPGTAVTGNPTDNIEWIPNFATVTTSKLNLRAKAGALANFVRLREVMVFALEAPKVNLSADAMSITEGDATAITLTITADANVSGDQTLNLWTKSDGLEASEFSLADTELVLLDGTNTVSTTITFSDDFFAEDDEVLSVYFSNLPFELAFGATNEVNVTLVDNDVAGFNLIESDGTTEVDEAGSTDEIDVVLTGQPEGRVVINLLTSDGSELGVDKTLLTFNETNWNVPQQVLVVGQDDQIPDGDQISSLIFSVDPGESANAFDNLPSQNVSVTNLEVFDYEAPSVPINLVGSNITASSFDLNWAASTDNVGVTAYEVFLDGVSQGTTSNTSYSFTGLQSSTLYTLTVSAQDAAGNASAESSGYSVTTTAALNCENIVAVDALNFDSGKEPENTTDGLYSTNWTYQIPTGQSNWIEYEFACTNVVEAVNIVFKKSHTRYYTFDIQVSTDGINFTTVESGLTSTITSVEPTDPMQAIDYETFTLTSPASASHVRIVGYGNSLGTGWFNIAALNFVHAPSDSEAPSIPTGLTESNLTASGFDLNWTASTDNVGVTAYEVFLDGVSQGTTSNTSYSFIGLQASTLYTLTVSAQDAAGNASAESSGYNVTTASVSCEDIIAVTALNFVSGKEPENTTDGLYSTNWTYQIPTGQSNWIEYEFACTNVVEAVNIVFKKPHNRYYTFDIQVSTDGTNFTTVESGLTSTIASVEPTDPMQASDYETFTLTSPASASHVRIVGYGNSLGTGWFNITALNFDLNNASPARKGEDQESSLATESNQISSKEILLYPNPAGHQNYVYLDVQSLNHDYLDIHIKDISGKTMLSKATIETMNEPIIQLSIVGFKNGVYLITVSAPDGSSYTKRMAITR